MSQINKKIRYNTKVHSVYIDENLQGFKEPNLSKGEEVMFSEKGELGNTSIGLSKKFRDLHMDARKSGSYLSGASYCFTSKDSMALTCCILPSSSIYRVSAVLSNNTLIPELEYLDLFKPYEEDLDQLSLTITVNPKNFTIYYQYHFYSNKADCYYITKPYKVDRLKVPK